MKTSVCIVTLALAVSTLTAFGQEAGEPPAAGTGPGIGQAGGPGGGPGHEPGGFHLLPPRAGERLNLTADQLQQIAALETEVKARLEKILTADQLQQLKKMRPPKGPEGTGDNAPRPEGNDNKPEGDRPAND